MTFSLGAGIASSVAYNPVADNYLVVFTDFNSPNPLFGQFVDASGEPTGPLIPLVEQSGASSAALAFDPVNEVYLLRWCDPNSGIWVQLLSGDGLPLGEALNIFAGRVQSCVRGPVVANKNGGGFLVTGVQITDSGDQQAVTRFVDVLSQCSATPTPTATPTATTTPTATATVTPTSTPTATPSATPRATPRPRPTPHPRPTPP